MLYVIVGTDFEQRKKKVDSLLATLEKKRPDALYISFDTDTFSPSHCEQYISGIGLFDEKSIIKLSSICESSEHKEWLFDHLDDLVVSPNAFVVSEQKLSTTDHKKIEKSGVSIEVFDSTTSNTKLDVFLLSDLLLQKKKRELLTTFWEYTNQGIPTEEIVGILVWQIKSINLALATSQQNSGLKPFVYNKAVKSPWNKKEALEQYFSLVTHYHESRRGGLALYERVEQFILGI